MSKEDKEKSKCKSPTTKGLDCGEIVSITLLMIFIPVDYYLITKKAFQPELLAFAVIALSGVAFLWSGKRNKLDTTGYDKESYIKCCAEVKEMKIWGAALGAAELSSIIQQSNIELTFVSLVAGFLLFLIGIHYRRLYEVIFRYEENAKMLENAKNATKNAENTPSPKQSHKKQKDIHNDHR